MQLIMRQASSVVLWLFTWPYHWTFKYYTLFPIKHIATVAAENNKSKIIKVIHTWRISKESELQFVKVASTVAAAAVIGVFSWPSVSESLWVAQAFWYMTLLLSIWAIILSSQQHTFLESMPLLIEASPKEDVEQNLKAILSAPTLTGADAEQLGTTTKYPVNWNMVYIWQCPTMLMSYSWATFMIALTLHVLKPFIRREPWGDSSKIAVCYVIVGGTTTLNFAWCSFWSYRSARKPWDKRHSAAPKTINTQVQDPGSGDSTGIAEADDAVTAAKGATATS
ncbi:hypothetical protein B0J14DRAFT_260731 [Halenospora varia]|nr:hypothetical protein B0J14DRAFT_260731 [Halenospora varia]